MASTTRNDERQRRSRARDYEEDDTLTEVGEDLDFGDAEDEIDPADRRLDPLRQPH